MNNVHRDYFRGKMNSDVYTKRVLPCKKKKDYLIDENLSE